MHDLKKIFSKLIVFFIPITICFVYSEYHLRTKHFVSSYATKKYYLEQQLDSIETLVLGSSQTFNGINPACFTSKTFNLANVSQTIYYDKRLTLTYLSKLPKLKTVVINISYFSFFYQLFDIKESWRDYYYLQHFGIKYYQLPSFCIENYAAFSVYKPLHCFKLSFNKFDDINAKEILQNGYQPKYVQEAISDSLGLIRVKIHDAENFAIRTKEIESDLETFVKELNDKKIKIVFLTTPVTPNYSKFCNKIIIDKNTTFITSLCKKYSAIYLNFFEDKRFVLNDFSDNDHLKNNGANKLSSLINDTLTKN